MTFPDLVWRGAEYLRPGLVPIDTLEPWPDNPRRGDVAAITASLDRFGQVRPVLVQGTRIVAGHHLVLAALEQGWTHVAVGDHDFGDEDEARAYLLADNRTAELGSVDEHLLAAQLAALRDTRGIGYSDRDRAQLDARLSALRAPEGSEPLKVPDVARSKPGEVYSLGEHRLLCGDARDSDALGRLLAGATVEVVWTDPPYGVALYSEITTQEEARRQRKRLDGLRIANDDIRDLRAFLSEALSAVDHVLVPGGRFYIAAPPGPKGMEFRLALDDVGWTFHQALVWVKDVMVLGHSDYHYAHEDVLYGWKPGHGRVGRGNHDGSRWYGGHDKTTVFQIPRPRRSEEHPTMKPIELIYRQLVNSTSRGDVVLDPFAGSGSTVIAAHELGARCMAVELDPGYCDVIRRRFADHVGDPSLRP